MKKSFKKFTAANGNSVKCWERRFKPSAEGQARPWFHVFAEAGGKKGIHSFHSKKEMLSFFDKACKMAASNNFVISDKAVTNFIQYGTWNHTKAVPVVKEF